jgi:DNA mismatch endonuclease (patch repair protein)
MGRKRYFPYMTDTLTKEKRSWNMSRIKGYDTKPEIFVRTLLHKAGFRFRLHQNKLPGKPDIILPKYDSVIFVHGCFWHRHEGCKFAYTPKSRLDFWNKKFKENVQRDKKKKEELKRMGWKVYTIWECETGQKEKLNRILKRITFALHAQNR